MHFRTAGSSESDLQKLRQLPLTTGRPAPCLRPPRAIESPLNAVRDNQTLGHFYTVHMARFSGVGVNIGCCSYTCSPPLPSSRSSARLAICDCGFEPLEEQWDVEGADDATGGDVRLCIAESAAHLGWGLCRIARRPLDSYHADRSTMSCRGVEW